MRERDRVDISGVAGRVDLNVFAAGVDELADHLALDRDDICEERIRIAVDRARPLVVEAL
jgi:hypothetical protein